MQADGTYASGKSLPDPYMRSVRPKRLPALLIFMACISLLILACWLQPNAKGLGTHTQMGLPGCGVLGMTGIPCATCGMTTAFSWAARGHLDQSFRTQPAGMILALMVGSVLIVSGNALISGAPLVPLGAALWRPLNIAVMATILIASWIYKILAVRGVL